MVGSGLGLEWTNEQKDEWMDKKMSGWTDG